MDVQHTVASSRAFVEAPRAVQKAFLKQVAFLKQNPHHPSLRAKKYGGAENLWQARVNQDWRFYFQIIGDTYLITNIIPHPK
jgi:plasmid maintenance system killer protein